MKRMARFLIPFLALVLVAALCAVPMSAEDNVIFIKDGAAGDGSSADSALKPTTGNYDTTASKPDKFKDAALYQAWEKLIAAGGGTIVVCGPYTLDNNNCKPIGASSADFMFLDLSMYKKDITITYTSVYNGVDYAATAGAKIVMKGLSHLTFPTSTLLENITIEADAELKQHFICGGLNNFTVGQGTKLIPSDPEDPTTYPVILGGFRNNGSGLTEGDANVIVDVGDENKVGYVYGLNNGSKATKGTSTVTIKSGIIEGKVYGDSKISAQSPLEGRVTINLEGGIFKDLIAGLNAGFVNTDGVVTVNVSGGNFTDCLGVFDADVTVASNLPALAILDMSKADAATAGAVKALSAGFTEIYEPAGGAAAPETTTAAPETTTAAPETTTAAPETTTAAPETTEAKDEAEATTAAPAAPKAEDGAPIGLIIGIVAAVIVIAVIVVIVVKKKK